MTPEQIRIAVAEEMGHKVCTHHPEKWEHRGPDGDTELYCTACKEYLGNMRCRKYDESLDACAEFEKALDIPERELYGVALLEALDIDPDYSPEPIELFNFVTATPLQRCEAFLRLKQRYFESK